MIAYKYNRGIDGKDMTDFRSWGICVKNNRAKTSVKAVTVHTLSFEKQKYHHSVEDSMSLCIYK